MRLKTKGGTTLEEMMNNSEKEEASYIFGKKVTGKKASAVGAVLGVLCGLVVVGVLAVILLSIF